MFINPFITDPFAEEYRRKKEEEQLWKNIMPGISKEKFTNPLGIGTEKKSPISSPLPFKLFPDVKPVISFGTKERPVEKVIGEAIRTVGGGDNLAPGVFSAEQMAAGGQGFAEDVHTVVKKVVDVPPLLTNEQSAKVLDSYAKSQLNMTNDDDRRRFIQNGLNNMSESASGRIAKGMIESVANVVGGGVGFMASIPKAASDVLNGDGGKVAEEFIDGMGMWVGDVSRRLVDGYTKGGIGGLMEAVVSNSPEVIAVGGLLHTPFRAVKNFAFNVADLTPGQRAFKKIDIAENFTHEIMQAETRKVTGKLIEDMGSATKAKAEALGSVDHILKKKPEDRTKIDNQQLIEKTNTAKELDRQIALKDAALQNILKNRTGLKTVFDFVSETVDYIRARKKVDYDKSRTYRAERPAKIDAESIYLDEELTGFVRLHAKQFEKHVNENKFNHKYLTSKDEKGVPNFLREMKTVYENTANEMRTPFTQDIYNHMIERVEKGEIKIYDYKEVPDVVKDFGYDTSGFYVNHPTLGRIIALNIPDTLNIGRLGALYHVFTHEAVHSFGYHASKVNVFKDVLNGIGVSFDTFITNLRDTFPGANDIYQKRLTLSEGEYIKTRENSIMSGEKLSKEEMTSFAEGKIGTKEQEKLNLYAGYEVLTEATARALLLNPKDIAKQRLLTAGMPQRVASEYVKALDRMSATTAEWGKNLNALLDETAQRLKNNKRLAENLAKERLLEDQIPRMAKVKEKVEPIDLNQKPLTHHEGAVTPRGEITATLKKEDWNIPIADHRSGLLKFLFNSSEKATHPFGVAARNINELVKNKIKIGDIKQKLYEICIEPILLERSIEKPVPDIKEWRSTFQDLSKEDVIGEIDKPRLGSITQKQWAEVNGQIIKNINNLPVGLGGKKGSFYELSKHDFEKISKREHQLMKIDEMVEMARQVRPEIGAVHDQVLADFGVNKLSELVYPSTQKLAVERLKKNDPYVMTILEAAKEGKMGNRERLNTLLKFYQQKAGVWGKAGASEINPLIDYPNVSWMVSAMQEVDPVGFSKIMERGNIRDASGNIKPIENMTIGDHYTFIRYSDINYQGLFRRIFTPRVDAMTSGIWGGKPKIGSDIWASLIGKYYHNYRPIQHTYLGKPGRVWFDTKSGILPNHPLREDFNRLLSLEVIARRLCYEEGIALTPDGKQAVLNAKTTHLGKEYERLIKLDKTSTDKFRINIKNADSAHGNYKFKGEVGLAEAVDVFIQHVNMPIKRWGERLLQEKTGIPLKKSPIGDDYMPMALDKTGSLSFSTANVNRVDARRLKRTGKIYERPIEELVTDPLQLWEGYIRQVFYDAEIQNTMLYIRDIAETVGGDIGVNAKKGLLPKGVSEQLLDSCAEFAGESSRILKENARYLYHKMAGLEGSSGARGVDKWLASGMYGYWRASRAFDKTMDFLFRRGENGSQKGEIRKRLEEAAQEYAESFKEGNPKILTRPFEETLGRLRGMYSTIHMLTRPSIVAQQLFQNINTMELLGGKDFFKGMAAYATSEGQLRIAGVKKYAESIYGNQIFEDYAGINKGTLRGKWEKAKAVAWTPVGWADMYARKVAMIVGANKFGELLKLYDTNKIDVGVFEKQLGLAIVYDGEALNVRNNLKIADKYRVAMAKAADPTTRAMYSQLYLKSIDNARNAYAFGICNAGNYLYDNFGGMRLYGAEVSFGQFQKFNYGKKQMFVHLMRNAGREFRNNFGENESALKGLVNTWKGLRDHEMKATTALGRTAIFEALNAAVIPKSKAGAAARISLLGWLLSKAGVPENISDGAKSLYPLTFTTPPTFARDGDKWVWDMVKGHSGGLAGFYEDFGYALASMIYAGATYIDKGEADFSMMADAMKTMARDLSPAMFTKNVKFMLELATDKEYSNVNMHGAILAMLFPNKKDMPGRLKAKSRSDWFESMARWLGIYDYKMNRPKKKASDKYTAQDEVWDNLDYIIAAEEARQQETDVDLALDAYEKEKDND